MIITQQQYLDYLNKLKNPDFQALIYPKGERIYKINLETRKSEAPTFLSVKSDHEAETILFQVDRFFDNMDLSTVNCVIQYINAEGKGYLYRVPFYDKITFQEQGKLIIPWFIKGPVTAASGSVQFSFQFYELEKEPDLSYQIIDLKEADYKVAVYYIYDEETKSYNLDETGTYDKTKKYYEKVQKPIGYKYNLNTQPSKSQVLYSLGLKTDVNLEEEPQVTILNEIFDEINQLHQKVLDWDIYWETLD